MEKFSYEMIPNLIICDGGHVTAVTGPTDKIEKVEKDEENVTLADLIPGVILVDAGTVTRANGKPIRYTAEY